MLPGPPLVVMQEAILSPEVEAALRGLALWRSWLSQPRGMEEIASSIVVQGLRPV